MTDEAVHPFGEDVSDDAVLLLAAAEELGLGQGVVKTTEGAFVVPQAVYDRAFGSPEPEDVPAKKAAAKKAAAKKE